MANTTKKSMLACSVMLLLILAFNSVAVGAESLSCEVATSCSDTILFRMSGEVNAHAGTVDGSSYPLLVCCSGVAGLGDSCSGNYAVALKLSSDNNAHVAKTTGKYDIDICLSADSDSGTMDCYYSTSCGSDACIVSISNDMNAHVRDCVTDPYLTKVCCSFNTPPSAEIISGDLIRNQNNTVTATVTDTEGNADPDGVRVSIASPKGDPLRKINDVKMLCSGDGYSLPCTYNVVPDCDWADDARIYVVAGDKGGVSTAATKDVNVVTPPENCINGIDDDCDKYIDRLDCEDCGVSVTSISVSDEMPQENTNIMVSCGSSVPKVNCIGASIDDVDCAFMSPWEGSNALFLCNVGPGAGVTKTVRCFVQKEKCCQIGSDKTKDIIVRASYCRKYPPDKCGDDPECELCPMCSGNKWNQILPEGDYCVAKGCCNYSCEKDVCGAECDLDVGACYPFCSPGNIRHFGGYCNEDDCMCYHPKEEDCDDQDNCYPYESGCEERDYVCESGEENCVYDPDPGSQHPDYYGLYEHYCVLDGVWKHSSFHDYYCDDSKCNDHISWQNDSLVDDCNKQDTLNCWRKCGEGEDRYIYEGWCDDYTCSDAACAISGSPWHRTAWDDDCSDCSCSCGGYNMEESLANEEGIYCTDGIDNDCDGTCDVDGCNGMPADPECIPLKCWDIPGATCEVAEIKCDPWEKPYTVNGVIDQLGCDEKLGNPWTSSAVCCIPNSNPLHPTKICDPDHIPEGYEDSFEDVGGECNYTCGPGKKPYEDSLECAVGSMGRPYCCVPDHSQMFCENESAPEGYESVGGECRYLGCGLGEKKYTDKMGVMGCGSHDFCCVPDHSQMFCENESAPEGYESVGGECNPICGSGKKKYVDTRGVLGCGSYDFCCVPDYSIMFCENESAPEGYEGVGGTCKFLCNNSEEPYPTKLECGYMESCCVLKGTVTNDTSPSISCSDAEVGGTCRNFRCNYWEAEYEEGYCEGYLEVCCTPDYLKRFCEEDNTPEGYEGVGGTCRFLCNDDEETYPTNLECGYMESCCVPEGTVINDTSPPISCSDAEVGGSCRISSCEYGEEEYEGGDCEGYLEVCCVQDYSMVFCEDDSAPEGYESVGGACSSSCGDNEEAYPDKLECAQGYMESCCIPKCEGIKYNGFCWFMGDKGDSCNDVCDGHGGVDSRCWDDDSSCAVAKQFVTCESCGSFSYWGPSVWYGNQCYFRGVGCPDPDASHEDRAPLCACAPK